MPSRRTRRCIETTLPVLVLSFIVFGAYVIITQKEIHQIESKLKIKQQKELVDLSVLHGGKINSAGRYLPYCGFTIVSKCHNIESLKYLEEFIENSHILRKIVSPLPYTSYHMTTHSIYTNSKPPIKFVQDWLDADPTHTVSPKRRIPTEDVYPIMKKAQQVWNDAGKVQFTAKSINLNRGKSVLSIRVLLKDIEVTKKFGKAGIETGNIFGTSYNVPLHISLGYFYSEYQNLTKEEQVKYEQELQELGEMLPKIFTMNPPVVTSFSSMTEFTQIVNE